MKLTKKLLVTSITLVKADERITKMFEGDTGFIEDMVKVVLLDVSSYEEHVFVFDRNDINSLIEDSVNGPVIVESDDAVQHIKYKDEDYSWFKKESKGKSVGDDLNKEDLLPIKTRVIELETFYNIILDVRQYKLTVEINDDKIDKSIAVFFLPKEMYKNCVKYYDEIDEVIECYLNIKDEIVLLYDPVIEVNNDKISTGTLEVQYNRYLTMLEEMILDHK